MSGRILMTPKDIEYKKILEYYYYEKKLSMNKIAEELKGSRISIWRAFEKYALKRRTIKTALRVHYQHRKLKNKHLYRSTPKITPTSDGIE